MKKILVGLSIAALSLMAADYQIGGGFGRSNVTKSDMSNYNFLNLKIGKYLPYSNLLRLDLERSISKIQVPDAVSNGSLTRALVNLEHDYDTGTKFTPYAFLGAGYQWVSGDYKNSIVGDLGLGGKYSLTDTLGLFVEGRALRAFHTNDNHYSVLGGLSYDFGGAPAAIPVAPKDSDHDGVIDENDKCPNTPEGVKVDTSGCPLDTDGDGVADYLDKCPNTPAGVKVDANGCPLDSDHDGVADYLDKCPNTPEGFKVDKNGCAITFNFEINFDTNSAKIKPEYMPKIEKFAEFLKSHPNLKAEIQGYTDNVGSYEYNMVLSERRAKAVYDALIKLGVPKDQLTWAGYGPKNPIASNDTPEGRAKNRRVVAKIIY